MAMPPDRPCSAGNHGGSDKVEVTNKDDIWVFPKMMVPPNHAHFLQKYPVILRHDDLSCLKVNNHLENTFN